MDADVTTTTIEPTPLAVALAKPTPRPVTCGSWVTLNPTSPDAANRLKTCKRLPRHSGECRNALTASAAHKAERAAAKKSAAPKKTTKKTATKRLTPAQRRREALAAIAERMADGTLSPSDAMAAVAALK